MMRNWRAYADRVARLSPTSTIGDSAFIVPGELRGEPPIPPEIMALKPVTIDVGPDHVEMGLMRDPPIRVLIADDAYAGTYSKEGMEKQAPGVWLLGP